MKVLGKFAVPAGGRTLCAPTKSWGVTGKAGPVVRSFFLQQAPLVKLLSWVIAHNDVHIQQGGGVGDIGLEDAHLDEIDAAGQDIDI